MARKAVYAGSFDPPTIGHLWVIREGAALFDELIVAVGVNPDKKPVFTPEERQAMLTEAIVGLPNVTVVRMEGQYLVRFAKSLGAAFILRGMRKEADYQPERDLCHGNAGIEPDIRSVFLMTPPEYGVVASSFVRSLVGLDGWEDVIRRYLPPNVWRRVLDRYGSPLYDRWAEVWSKYVGTDHRPPYRDLLARYAEPHRAYHDFAHIRHCLELFNPAWEDFQKPYAAEIALWAHDAVYDPTRSDNEAQSAALLHKYGQGESVIDEYILETEHRGEPKSDDGALIRDIDLASLGADRETFDRNSSAIRREYAHVPDMQFRVGRAAILRNFLHRPRIYFTDRFADQFEATARANLARAISQLEGLDSLK